MSTPIPHTPATQEERGSKRPRKDEDDNDDEMDVAESAILTGEVIASIHRCSDEDCEDPAEYDRYTRTTQLVRDGGLVARNMSDPNEVMLVEKDMVLVQQALAGELGESVR